MAGVNGEMEKNGGHRCVKGWCEKRAKSDGLSSATSQRPQQVPQVRARVRVMRVRVMTRMKLSVGIRVRLAFGLELDRSRCFSHRCSHLRGQGENCRSGTTQRLRGGHVVR